MPDPWRQTLNELGILLDEEFIPSLYQAASIRPEEVRSELAEAGLDWFDPTLHPPPSLERLDEAAQWVIDRATRKATVRGALVGVAGLAAVPPELVANWLQLLRLGQRLAVIYGHDPETARGKLLLWRAVTQVFELQFPTEEQVTFRVRDLPTMLPRITQPIPNDIPIRKRLLQLAASRAVTNLTRKLGRALPGVGAGIAATHARRRFRAQGQQIAQVFRRARSGTLLLVGPVEEAVELDPN